MSIERRSRFLDAWGLLACMSLAALAGAQDIAATEPQLAKPNTGAISLDLSVDWGSQYYFRGVLQENDGLIFQPGATVTAALYEAEESDFITSLSAYAGIWNSIQDSSTAATNSNKPWYETDYTVGASTGLPWDLSLDTFFVFYTYPNGSVSAISEFDVNLAWDDAAAMQEIGLFALNPHALLAFELSDAGGDEDSYWEVGVEPSFVVLESEDYPLSLSVPVTGGFSLEDYYKGSTFGYASVGLNLSLPLAVVPVEYGAWSASAGVTLLMASDSAQDLGPGGHNDLEAIASVGLSLAY